MTSVTCPRWGNTFETAARSGRTRCGNCRAAVTVPGAAPSTTRSRSTEHMLVVARLTCGHADVVAVHPGNSLRSAVSGLVFECPDAGTISARIERVLGTFSES